MKVLRQSRLSRIHPAAFLVAICIGMMCSITFGHEWTIDDKKVKAKAVDYNGANVVLENEKGQRKAFPINQLAAKDLQYLANLLSIRNAEIQQQLEQQQIGNQQVQLMLQFADIWTVRMVAANGDTGWKNYFAINSYQAKQQAWNEFRNIRITSVQKMRRAGTFGAANNMGMTPAIGLQPIIRNFNFQN